MTAGLAKVIKKRQRSYVVERRTAVTIDTQTGLGAGGVTATGTILAHIQPYDGPRRVDTVPGVSTNGLIKIWVISANTVQLDPEDPEDDPTDGGVLRCDPGEGGTGAPGDHVQYDDHRWLVIERTNWNDDGSHRQYLGRDEGAIT